jgi:cbb3-type cytochrome oxidase subunit 3
MSETFSVQLTAAATLALAVLAILTAALAYLAWRKQSKEVSDQAEMLRLQAEEIRQAAAEREREAHERRRAQAELVYMWHAPVHVEVDGKATPGMTVEAYVRNTSPQPIYDLWFEWTLFTDISDWINDKTYCGETPLMPGAMAAARAPLEPRLISARLQDVSVAATFRDRTGVWWRTHASGFLEGLPNQLEARAVPETALEAE